MEEVADHPHHSLVPPVVVAVVHHVPYEIVPTLPPSNIDAPVSGQD